MTGVNAHYNELSRKCSEILTESLHSDRISPISESHSALFDYTNWLTVVEERPEHSIIKIAVREYQMAILSTNLGLYTQAFVGLRFFFERTLIAIQFSSKELDLRLWQRGERDSYWQEILDEGNGVFSTSFCRAFFPELKDEIQHFKIIAQKVYRECSEYVHGNLSVHDKIPEVLKFDEFLFNEWHSKAKIIKRVILFCFCLRYLKDVKSNKISLIEEITREEFGYLEVIRDVISLIKK